MHLHPSAPDNPQRTGHSSPDTFYRQLDPPSRSLKFYDAPPSQRRPYYKFIDERGTNRAHAGSHSHRSIAHTGPFPRSQPALSHYYSTPRVLPIPYRIIKTYANMGTANSKSAQSQTASQNAHSAIYAPGPRSSAPGGRPQEAPSGMAAFGATLQRIAPGQSTEQLLNPPPPSFLRPPPRNLAYPPFEPTFLIGPSERLDKGFGNEIPPAREQPHPFTTHDIRQEDWSRFLGDLKKAAGLTLRNQVVAGVAPMAAGIGLPGMFISRAIQSRMRRRKRGPAGELVDHWNHYFFNPRGIQLTLAQGGLAFSGQSDGPPPDVAAGRYRPSTDEYDDYGRDVPNASDSVRHSRIRRRDARGQGMSRRERHSQRPEQRGAERSEGRGGDRQERRQRGRDERGVRDENWRLVISPTRPARAHDVLWSR